jgi:hypothetical protein
VKITPDFFDGIRELIAGARSTVARGVDLVQVHTNFEIGRRIVQEEQRGKDRAAYGKEVIKALADRLTGEFGKGFSTSSLAYMRTFYLLYEDRSLIFQTVTGKSGSSQIGQSVTDQSNLLSKSQTVSGQLAIFQTLSGKSGPTPRPFTLSWSHYVFLLGVKNPNERSFYEIEAGEQNWTVRELKRQFDSDSLSAVTKRAFAGSRGKGKPLSNRPTCSRNLWSWSSSDWTSGTAIPSPIWNPPSSARSSASCWKWAKGSSSRRARSVSPSTRSTSSWTWFSTTVCFAATSCSI